MKEYTERLHGYQIRDVVYMGRPPKDAPVMFDIVKWYQCEPNEVMSMEMNSRGTYDMKKKIVTEYCYSVAVLEWNAHESWFDFKSVGTRWLEEKPEEDVIDMIMKFCEEKQNDLKEDL